MKSLYLWKKDIIDLEDYIDDDYDKDFYNCLAINKLDPDRHTWRHYHKVYSKYITEKRYEEMNILEIGTWKGYGALAFANFFENSNIYTLDIGNRFRKEFLETKNPISFTQANSMDPVDEFNDIKFDFIIEDGLHRIDVQMNTFIDKSKHIKRGGYYFIEDMKFHMINHDSLHVIFFNHLKKLKENGVIEYVKLYQHENPVFKYWFENVLSTKEEDLPKLIDIINRKFSLKWPYERINTLENTSYNYNNYIMVIKFK